MRRNDKNLRLYIADLRRGRNVGNVVLILVNQSDYALLKHVFAARQSALREKNLPYCRNYKNGKNTSPRADEK